MDRIQDLKVYDEINELLSELHERKQALAIVTKSPDMIPRAFIGLYGWPIDIVIGYHQVGRRKQKPAPDALLLAMQKSDAKAENTFHVGDQPEDTEASRAANIVAIGAGWGLADTRSLEASAPDHLFLKVSDLRGFFKDAV